MDIMPLLEELQAIARNGLWYATNEYDRERYQRLFDIASHSYAQVLDLPPAEVRQRLAAEFGTITPKLGAEAAIFDQHGHILLMLRADNQCWCLPCGAVEVNETPADAAVREAWEETGLHIQVVQLVDVFTRMPNALHGPHTLVVVVYLCEVRGGSLHCSHEGLELRYWSLDDVPIWHWQHEVYAQAAYATWLALHPQRFARKRN